MKILFVYPPNQLMPIETPRPDGSLGPLYLIGALREAGIDADLLDATAEAFDQQVMQENGLIRVGMNADQLSEKMSGYDIIGVHSNFTPQTKMAFEVARLAKEQGKKVIAGGVNARNLYVRFMQSDLFDSVCTGEGEHFISYGRDKIITNLDELPFPAWDKLPFHLYDRIASPHGVDLTPYERYAPLMTSRGCPFRCSYCHISTEKGGIGDLRLKSVERVLQEIEVLKSLGVKKVFIEDDSLLAKKGRVKQIFNAIRTSGLTIADVNGVNLVHFFHKTDKLEPDVEYMRFLYESGFKQIVFPVESGSQRILDTYASAKLNLEKMDVVELARIAADIGILCPVNMMIGFPDETEKEMMQSIQLARRLIGVGVPYVSFFIPIPFPGSKLFDIAVRDGYVSPNFDPDIFNWKNGVMENTLVPKERIVELRDWAFENVNPPEHVKRRVQESIGHRWHGGA